MRKEIVQPHNFIPSFDERRGDLDAYFVSFERVWLAATWPSLADAYHDGSVNHPFG